MFVLALLSTAIYILLMRTEKLEKKLCKSDATQQIPENNAVSASNIVDGFISGVKDAVEDGLESTGLQTDAVSNLMESVTAKPTEFANDIAEKVDNTLKTATNEIM